MAFLLRCCLRCAASGLVLNSRSLAPDIAAVDRDRIERVEGFPGDALRIERPVLVALGVAARGTLLRHYGHICLCETRTDFLELVAVLGLDAQVIETGLVPAIRDGEIDPRIVQHPFRVVGLLDAWLSAEKRGIEADALFQIMHGDVNVKPFHWLSFSWAREHRRRSEERR